MTQAADNSAKRGGERASTPGEKARTRKPFAAAVNLPQPPRTEYAPGIPQPDACEREPPTGRTKETHSYIDELRRDIVA